MLFVFLVGSTVLVLLYAMWYRVVLPRWQQVRWHNELSRSGMEAEAVILNIEFTGIYIENEPQVRMLVQVIPDSRKNFVSEMHEVISLMDLSYLRAGTRLRVKYIPGDTKRVLMVRKKNTF